MVSWIKGEYALRILLCNYWKLIFFNFLKKIRPDLIEIADKIDPNVDIGVQSDSSSDSSSSSSSSSSESESDDEDKQNESDESFSEDKKSTKRF